MQTWKLNIGDPLSLTLAADARLASTEYTDDQIWEIASGGEPAALALQTTYGLRAHWLRLFPRFVRSEGARVDPAGFHTPPQILNFSANTFELSFEPIEGLEVLAEYWIAESQVAAGRIKITNQSILPQNFRFEWVALLNPIDRQGGMVPIQNGPTYVLSGETTYLCPVVFLTGGPQPGEGPYPSLAVEMELYPGSSRQLSWAAAAMRTYEASFEAARAATARPWEAEHTRIELLNHSQQVQIQTGDPDWDAAFALTQKTAFGLLMKNPLYLPETSFVLSRRPDQGFSRRGDGSDYAHLWSGQTALDAYYLSSLILPGAPELAAGFVRNFLAAQEESGAIDWKPGLGGQRSKQLAQPLLATLAVQAAPYLSAVDWYREVFPALLKFFDAWFTPKYDQDGDGFPEWEHPLQSGLEDSPVFDRWSPHAQGIEVSCLEAPGLGAMLYRECQSLIEMAGVLEEAEKAEAAYARLSGTEAQLSGATEALPLLRERQAALREAIESTWDAKARIYHYRDYQTHLSQPGQLVTEFAGSERISTRKRFSQPRRLVIHLNAAEERTFAISIVIHGFTEEGEVSETLSARSFTWLRRHARATTQNTFVALKRIEAIGLTEHDQMSVFTTDLTQEDCSLFLPLWAGMPSEEQACHLIDESLWPRYLMPYGLALVPPGQHLQEELPGLHTAVASALLPWNHLIGEGLLRYGRQAQAADLVTRLMSAVVDSLKTHQAFRQYYHAETGLAAGERGHLHGLAPLGLFLQTLGIRQLSAKEIILDGFNPFPWTIHVQYRKAHLTFYSDKTEVTFSGGQRITVDRPGIHQITLS